MNTQKVFGLWLICLSQMLFTAPAAATDKGAAAVRPRTTDGFKQCVDANQSPIFPGNKLVNLCLDRHEAEMEPTHLEASGAYVKVDAQTQFALRVRNAHSSMMITRFLVILKHDKADRPQVLPVGPVSLLPGEVTTMRLGGLDHVPEVIATAGAPDFKFSVESVRGLELKLR